MSDLNEFGAVEATITDADGVEHHYEITPHDAIPGQRIMFTLLGAGLPAALEAVEGALGGGEGESVLDVDVATLKLGAPTQRLVSAILQTQPEKLTRTLLANTLRDGKPLDKDQHFRAAYQRNYFELLKACYAVVVANRFLPLDAISSAVSKFAEKATAKTDGKGQDEKSGESEKPSGGQGPQE